jgi:uncharacterized protein YjbI with pentapeptide repeats
LTLACFENAFACQASFVRSTLRGIQAAEITCEETEFTAADLTNACFNDSSFVFAAFGGAKLVNVSMRGAILRDCDWIAATVEGGDWSNTSSGAGKEPSLPFKLPRRPG